MQQAWTDMTGCREGVSAPSSTTPWQTRLTKSPPPLQPIALWPCRLARVPVMGSARMCDRRLASLVAQLERRGALTLATACGPKTCENCITTYLFIYLFTNYMAAELVH